MGPGQFEIPCIMLLDGKGGICKAKSGVTGGAVGGNSVFHKLGIVIILMAVGALLMPYRVCHIPFMAGFAGNVQVLVHKRELRF